MPKPYKVLTIYHKSQSRTGQHFTDNKYYRTKHYVQLRILNAIREPAVVNIGMYLSDGQGMWTEIARIAPMCYKGGSWQATPHNPLLDSAKLTAFFDNDRVVEAMREQWPEWAEREANHAAKKS